MKISAWFHLLAAALLVTPAGASPVRPQTLASADAVPEGLSAPEWSSIRQQYEQQRHAAYPVAGGYQARNPGQQWETRFDGRGFTVTSEPGRAAERGVHAASTSESEGTVKRSEARAPRLDAPAWQWGLELQSYGFAGQERAVVDVSDPATPHLVEGNSAVLACDLVTSGNQVFVAGYAEGLQVFDVVLYQALPLLPLPALRVIRSGDALLITWPASVSGAVLETTDISRQRRVGSRSQPLPAPSAMKRPSRWTLRAE